MTIILFAFAAGVVTTLWSPVLPPPWMFVPPLLSACAVLLAGGWRAPWRRRGALILLALLLGSAWAGWQAEQRLAMTGPPIEPSQRLTVTGTVVSLPQWHNGHAAFDLRVVSVARTGAPVAPGDRLRVRWFGAPGAPQPGEHWRMTLEVEAPRTRHNPGAFDARGWRLRHGLRASARVSGEAKRLGTGPGGLAAWRGHIGEQVSAAVSDIPHSGIIRALVIGDRGGMDHAMWSVLTATGTNHLMAISGLHIGLVAGLVLLLARGLWRLWPAGTLALPAQRAAIMPTLLAATGYALLAGFSVPTQRALIMLGVGLLAVWHGWLGTPWRVWALALVAVLVIDPLAALAPGTWLSFAAAAWILYSLGGRLQSPGRVGALLQVQWRLALGLAPLTLLFFDYVAWAGMLANLVAVPVFGLLVVPLALLGTLIASVWEAGGVPLLRAAAFVVAWLWPLLEGLATLSQQLPAWPVPPPWRILVLGVALVVLLAPRALPGRECGALLVLVALWPPAGLPGGQLELSFPDLAPGGQAVVLHSRQARLVYDTGPPAWAGAHGGGRALSAMLAHQTAAPTHLVLSHVGSPVSGGWSRLAPMFAGQPAWRGGLAPWQPAGTVTCEAGMTRRVGGMLVRAVHPPASWDRPGRAAVCVVRVTVPDGPVVMFAGDLGAAGQRALLRNGAHRGADVVVMYGEALDGPLARLLACQHRLLAPPAAGAGMVRWRLMPGEPPQRKPVAATARRFWHSVRTR